MAEACFGNDKVHLSVRLDDAYDDDRTIHAPTAIEAIQTCKAVLFYLRMGLRFLAKLMMTH